MQVKPTLPFFTLILMISFASVNAVLFTPALPDIASFFSLPDKVAQYTVSWFLIGYAIGQLFYGPLANRYGRKSALYIGIVLQIVASLVCVLSGVMDLYPLLVMGRFIMALGSGVGLNMTFTLVIECYEPKVASQKIAYLNVSLCHYARIRRCIRRIFECALWLDELFHRRSNVWANFTNFYCQTTLC